MGEGLSFLLRDTFRERRRNGGGEIVIDHSSLSRFNQRARRKELGFEPAVDFRTGTRKAVAWYREQGWL